MLVTISVSGIFHAFHLAEQLQRRGYLKKIITNYPKIVLGKWKSGVSNDKIEAIPIQTIHHLLGKLGINIYSLNFFLRDMFDRLASKNIKNCDILVGFSGVGLHSIKKAKRNGIITIVERGSSHSLYSKKILYEEYKKFGIKKAYSEKFIKRELKEYREADYISIPSKFVERTFLENGVPKEKLIRVPYGVDIEEFKQTPKKDNIFRIVYLGQLSLRKGVHYLLQAYSELKLKNTELLIGGRITDENIKPFLKKYEGNYKFAGYIPQENISEFYSQGSVFVLPSIEEGLAMVQLQAMACGLPVICTTNTGGEDIIRNGKEGFIVPIRDVEALKEKILYLSSNPEKCKRMGYNAKKMVRENFTWDYYGDRIIKKYKEILN